MKRRKMYRHNFGGENTELRALSSETIFLIWFFQNSFAHSQIGHFYVPINVHF